MPDYEITIAGRMGPVVASCLPGLRVVAPPATVLRALVTDPGVVPKLLGMLADHHLSPFDIRINPASTASYLSPRRRPSMLIFKAAASHRHVNCTKITPRPFTAQCASIGASRLSLRARNSQNKTPAAPVKRTVPTTRNHRPSVPPPTTASTA